MSMTKYAALSIDSRDIEFDSNNVAISVGGYTLSPLGTSSTGVFKVINVEGEWFFINSNNIIIGSPVAWDSINEFADLKDAAFLEYDCSRSIIDCDGDIDDDESNWKVFDRD